MNEHKFILSTYKSAGLLGLQNKKSHTATSGAQSTGAIFLDFGIRRESAVMGAVRR